MLNGAPAQGPAPSGSANNLSSGSGTNSPDAQRMRQRAESESQVRPDSLGHRQDEFTFLASNLFP